MKKLLLDWLPRLLRMDNPNHIKPPAATGTKSKTGRRPPSVRRKNQPPYASNAPRNLPNNVHGRDPIRYEARKNPDSDTFCRHLLAHSNAVTPESLELKLIDPGEYPNFGAISPPPGNGMYAPTVNQDISGMSEELLDQGLGLGIGVEHCACQQQSSEEIEEILSELRFMSNRLRKEDQIADIVGEWRFAAMVIDRLCLIIFSGFTLISTCVCIIAAPHLIV